MAETDISAISTTLEDISLDVATRHRRERKELQAKIQALKKNAPKSDKKKRKEAMEEIAKLENEMEKRHEAEMKEADQRPKKENDQEVEIEKPTQPNGMDDKVEDTSDVPTKRISKAQKRRDKKAREAKQREKEILAEVESEDAQLAPKIVESRNLKEKLVERNLSSHQIPSDGDCLYNAVRHQLTQSGLCNLTVQDLRNETANYIRANKDALICYMTHPETGDLLNDTEFETYCENVRSTAAWGGQIELKALSSILKVPIEVIQAVGPPTVLGSEEFAGPNLTITYHRHLYSLGEHYNSTVPKTETSEDSEA